MFDYKKLCIYELRELARKVGVKAPTSLKRAELIKRINDICSGKEKPFSEIRVKGRPAKTFQIFNLKAESTNEFIDFLLDIRKQNIELIRRIDEIINKLKI